MPDRTTPELALLALRYAADDLSPEEVAAFELRLADDQPAREALAEAIRLSASAVGQPPPAPGPATRIAVRDRLFPTWLTRLFPVRAYRGHPAAWAALGGCAAAGVLAVGWGWSDDRPQQVFAPPVAPPFTTVISVEAPRLGPDSLPVPPTPLATPQSGDPMTPLGPRVARPMRPAEQPPMPMPSPETTNG